VATKRRRCSVLRLVLQKPSKHLLNLIHKFLRDHRSIHPHRQTERHEPHLSVFVRVRQANREALLTEPSGLLWRVPQSPGDLLSRYPRPTP